MAVRTVNGFIPFPTRHGGVTWQTKSKCSVPVLSTRSLAARTKTLRRIPVSLPSGPAESSLWMARWRCSKPVCPYSSTIVPADLNDRFQLFGPGQKLQSQSKSPSSFDLTLLTITLLCKNFFLLFCVCVWGGWVVVAKYI